MQIRSVARILAESTSAIVTLADSGIERPSQLDGKVYASYGARYEGRIVQQMIKNDGGKGEFQESTPPMLGIWNTLLKVLYNTLCTCIWFVSTSSISLSLADSGSSPLLVFRVKQMPLGSSSDGKVLRQISRVWSWTNSSLRTLMSPMATPLCLLHTPIWSGKFLYALVIPIKVQLSGWMNCVP